MTTLTLASVIRLARAAVRLLKSPSAIRGEFASAFSLNVVNASRRSFHLVDAISS